MWNEIGRSERLISGVSVVVVVVVVIFITAAAT